MMDTLYINSILYRYGFLIEDILGNVNCGIYFILIGMMIFNIISRDIASSNDKLVVATYKIKKETSKYLNKEG